MLVVLSYGTADSPECAVLTIFSGSICRCSFFPFCSKALPSIVDTQRKYYLLTVSFMALRKKSPLLLKASFCWWGSFLKGPSEVFSSTTGSTKYMNSNCTLNCALKLDFWVQLFVGASALIL